MDYSTNSIDGFQLYLSAFTLRVRKGDVIEPFFFRVIHMWLKCGDLLTEVRYDRGREKLGQVARNEAGAMPL